MVIRHGCFGLNSYNCKQTKKMSERGRYIQNCGSVRKVSDMNCLRLLLCIKQREIACFEELKTKICDSSKIELKVEQKFTFL